MAHERSGIEARIACAVRGRWGSCGSSRRELTRERKGRCGRSAYRCAGRHVGFRRDRDDRAEGERRKPNGRTTRPDGLGARIGIHSRSHARTDGGAYRAIGDADTTAVRPHADSACRHGVPDDHPSDRTDGDTGANAVAHDHGRSDACSDANAGPHRNGRAAANARTNGRADTDARPDSNGRADANAGPANGHACADAGSNAGAVGLLLHDVHRLQPDE